MAQGRDLLTQLGALDAGGAVTAHGKAMARLGLHPRLAHMILVATARGSGRLACETAAILSERDLFRGPASERHAELRSRIAVFRGQRDEGASVDRGAVAQARALAQQWMRLANVPDRTSDDFGRLGEIVALAYPDRIAQARGGGQFLLANGRGAVLPEADAMGREPYLAVATLDGDARSARIFLAAPIDRTAIDDLFADRLVTVDEVRWDAQSESAVATRERRLGALALDRKPLGASASPAVAQAMAEGLRQLGAAALPWTREARAIQARVAFLRRLDPEAWPDLSDAALMADPPAWLGERLNGVTRRAHLARI